MKKIMMMAVAALMATVNANAQFEAGTFSLQPMFGIGVATVTNAEGIYFGTTKLENQITGAALLGVEAEYQITDKFSAAAGLNYTLQGTGWADFKEGETKYTNIHVELGYVKIPIVANYYVTKGLAIKAGIQFGFLASTKMKLHQETKLNLMGENRDVDVDYSFDMKDSYESFDFSIPIGLSYQFNSPWVIDARYQLGLTKLNKVSGEGIKDYKNSVFMITVGYKFAL